VQPRLSRDLLVYGLGELLVKAFSLITLPIYTRIFTAPEFGALSIFMTVSGFALAIIALGGDSAFVRYFLSARTLDERRTITSTWIAFLGVWSVVATALIVPASPFLTDIAVGGDADSLLMVLALVIIPIRLTNVMCAQALRNEFRAVAYTVMNVATLALTVVGALVGAIALDLGIAGVLVGTLGAEVVMLPTRLWTIRHLLRPVFSSRYLVRLIGYGLPLVPTSIAYWVFTTSDRVLIGNLSTLEQVGLYSVAVSVANIANIAIVALGQAWTPHAVQRYESDPDEAGVLFGRMFIYILFAFGTLAVGLTALANIIVGVLASDEFSGAAAGVAPLAIGMVAYATTQITAAGITLRNRTAYFALYSWLAAGVNIVLNILLIPSMGMVGAGLATAAAYIALTVSYGLTSHRLWRMDYQWRRAAAMIGLIVLGVAGAAALTTVKGLDGGFATAVAGGAYTAAFAVLLVLVAGRQAIVQTIPWPRWTR
jgi:O-antigen/teichoic acid export membrane protein